MASIAPPRLLTVTETADLARVAKTTVYRWIRAGELPAIRLGGSIRIPRDELEDLLTTGGGDA